MHIEAINFEHTGKVYSRRGKQVEALTDFSLTVDEGEIVGLVGPNGAGKSTMVKIACGILTPSSGTVRTLGYLPSRERVRLASSIGAMFGQRSSLWYLHPAPS
ncbi:MAG: ATP-binding cassette domain-containing protein [Bacillota bacterium]